MAKKPAPQSNTSSDLWAEALAVYEADTGLVDRANGQLIFNLGHNLRAAFFLRQNSAQFFDIAFFPDKTERDEIDSELRAERDIGHVLFR